MSALQVAIDRLWAALGDRDGLMPSLPDDAVMARARGGEAKAAMPRLMELLVADELTHIEITEPFDLLRESEWGSWPDEQRGAVQSFLDTWWEWTRTALEPETPPGLVLACLSRLEVSHVRWLGPWLDDLDGSSARHLAQIVIEQLPEPEWEGHEDARSQILGWARTEPVIIGLTVVGGIHLDDGQLGAALDQML